MVEFGVPIFNYIVGYDLNNRAPLLYEKYPGSINNVSQLQFMVEKAKEYVYPKVSRKTTGS